MRNRRAFRITLLAVLGSLIVLAFLAASPALAARSGLLEARRAMEEGRASLLAGDVDAAGAAFARAEESFRRAQDQIGNPVLRVASYLPLIGRTPDTVEAIAVAGKLVASAAGDTITALEGFSEAPGGLREGGAIPVASISEMAPLLQEALRSITQAGAELDASESSLLLPSVSQARIEFVEQLEDADRLLRAASALAEGLPEFLGASGTRRYFFGAQSPAELRGTGGLIGAYSILTVTDGRLDFGPFAPVQTLDNLTGGEVPPPTPSFADRYDRFGGGRFWLNLNMTPDFPSAATAIERLYAEVQGEQLDGTIVADPFALQALVASSGPVDVPGTDVSLTPENTVQVLAHDAYAEFDDPAVRKRVLGDSARLVFQRFLQDVVPADPFGAARTLVETAAGGHVLLHATDVEMQRTLEIAGASGELLDPKGDYLGVFSNNAAGNKADFYLEPSVHYEVLLQEDGSAMATATVELTNGAPSTGEPPVIIGPYDKRFEAGENRTYVSTYCAASCRLESFEAPGEETEVIGSQEELGHPVFSTFVNTLSGETSTLEFNLTSPSAWDAAGGLSSYTLTYQGQNTIRPTRLALDIRTPEGAAIVSSSPGFQIEGDHAVWTGEPGDEMRFEIAFERSEPAVSRRGWGIVLLAAAGIVALCSLVGLYVRRRRRLRYF